MSGFLLWIFMAVGCGGATKPPEEKPSPATVKWEAPVQGALEEWSEFIGTTVPAPDRVARMTSPIEGRVISVFEESGKIPIAEGQWIERGTPLIQLDATLALAALAKAEAVQDVLREEEKQAQFAVELAASEVERLKLLKAEEDKQPSSRTLVSPVERLKAEYALKDTQSKLKASRGRLTAGQREKELLSAHLNLHTLVAPISGSVGRSLVIRGQTLSVGTLVTEIVDLKKTIDVLCYVPPGMLGRLQLKQPALTGGFDADPAAPKGIEAEGEIVYIADQAEPETGNFAVKIRFSNADARLRANRVQRVRVLTKPGNECLNLRESAVQSDEEIPTVVIVTDIKTGTNADGKDETTGVARRLRAVLGTRDRTLHQIEIVSLDDPEKDPAKRWTGEIKSAVFVVEGGQGLQTGDTVKLDVEVD